MHSHKTITIVTSPPPSTKPLPGCTSPTTNGPVQYRIEERSRTVYVTSDVCPSQWEQHSLDQIFSLTEESGSTSQVDAQISSALTVETRVSGAEDAGIVVVPEGRARSVRNGSHRSRRSEFMSSPKSSIHPLDSPRRVSPRTLVRPRILFYHKHDPHYGFTNFSDHHVVYKGKKYPTSEHLFQSFKVSVCHGYLT